jgi:hypothetical protein
MNYIEKMILLENQYEITCLSLIHGGTHSRVLALEK